MPDNSLKVPCWCPQCQGPMKGKSTNSFYDFGVCIVCFIEFIEGREQRWKDGWRPSTEELAAFRLKYQ
jgi:hypothetical protein